MAVGFPIAGRRDPVLDELVGFFVNTLVLRVELAGDPTVAELLDQVRVRSLAAYEHQDVPFEVLVDRLNPSRSLTHHSLVQVMLAWQDADPAAELALGDLRVSQLPVDTRTARMDVALSLAEKWNSAGEPAGICGEVEYRTDVFDAASVETLIERLRRVLVALTANPAGRLSSIDVLDGAEHARLDEIGNRAVVTQPATTPMSVPVLFAAQVARAPQDVAVVYGERRWTYRELDNASNRLAHLLIGYGARPGNCVALLFSRSAEAIVAMLAVLKTGAAYLPIDPVIPTARIRFMLDDAAPIAAITTADLRSRLDDHGLLVIDVNDPAVETQPGTDLPGRRPKTSPTSSTPRVPLAHPRGWRSATTTSPNCWGRWMRACRRRGVVAQSFPGVRRVGVGDLRCAARWGRLVVVPEAIAGSPDDFHEVLVAEQASVLTQTPSAVRALSPQGLESTALVVVGRLAQPRWWSAGRPDG
ncbi:AMP-binding enzyme family protein [Mycobacterium xenopi 4042]|uniref:AMP-binding enzyme family protein n=1 Tax=Mycobacterium xenopi 4042 TaxID=1299334 RepID=X8AP37_MYCXE|nr:AMP-binding enzyme family protein [Mycobacterium xenopi 4042]